MVAESIVTFGPIDQFGWRSACSTVAALIASSAQVRNGPPDAVRMMRWTSSRRPRAQRLENRIVFGVDRQHCRTGRRGAAHEQRAGADQTFLVGERDGCAALDRRQCRLQACGPADRGHDPIGRTQFAASITAPSPAAAAMPEPASPSFSSA